MATAPDRRAPQVVELLRIGVDELEPVLSEERLAWRSTLHWDFSASADLVRRFVNVQALNGFALISGGAPVGYAYYVCEDRKGLVGDVYVLRDWATAENEELLLSSVLHALIGTPGIERVEAQLMMVRSRGDRTLPFARMAQIYPRIFMLADCEEAARLPARALPGIALAEWNDARREEAALLIATAYQGHVDSSINDQYRSYPGAKRFLNNVVNYPGCGAFYDPASWIATNSEGRMVGLVLSSLVAQDTGHITQVCVAPEAHGSGIGYELVRRSTEALRAAGCENTSLTVTASNAKAVALYQRMGFRAIRRFNAYVWEGF